MLGAIASIVPNAKADLVAYLGGLYSSVQSLVLEPPSLNYFKRKR